MYSKIKFLWFITILLIVIISCKNDDNFEEEDDNIPTGSTSSINEINNALKFNSSQFINDDAPANSNSGDLKINKDTINIWPGIKNRISILNHTNISITGVLVHMPNADGYHDVAIETEESNDTLTVFYVDIDPDGLDLPLNNDIIISPTDGSGNIIDEFDHPIYVDTPFDPTNTNYTPSGLTCKPAFSKNLLWIYTIKNNVVTDAPGHVDKLVPSIVEGCCHSGSSSSTCHPSPENASVEVRDISSSTAYEHILFLSELPIPTQDFLYTIKKTFNNYSPADTDFCSEVAGYNFTQPEINTGGDYYVDESASSEDYAKIIVKSLSFTTQELLDTGFPPRLQVNENNPNINYILGCKFLLYTYFTETDDFLFVYETVSDSSLFASWND